MKDPKHGRLMLDMATADLQAISHMLSPHQFTDSIFGFHCQQAVEKLLKAWLSLSGVAFPRTHDLRILFDLAEDIDPQAVATFRELEDLTDYGVQFRYEAPFDLEPLDRLALADQVGALERRVSGLMASVT